MEKSGNAANKRAKVFALVGAIGLIIGLLADWDAGIEKFNVIINEVGKFLSGAVAWTQTPVEISRLVFILLIIAAGIGFIWFLSWVLVITQSSSRIYTLFGLRLNIVSARYGAIETWQDVTKILRAKVRFNRLVIKVNNEMLGGDPYEGAGKELVVTYYYNGAKEIINAPENSTLEIPGNIIHHAQ
jgi:hypothetical protein